MTAHETSRSDSGSRDGGAHGPEPTRERLIRAAVDIIATEGVAAMTTVSVCKRVGIAQSSYYTHFASRAELMRAVGDISARHGRIANREARASFGAHPDRENRRAMFRLPLDQAQANPELYALGVQARFAPADSTLGRHGRELAAAARHDLAAFLQESGRSADPAVAHRYEMLADCVNSMIVGLATGHLEGRYPDTEEIVDLLVLMSAGSADLGAWLGWASRRGVVASSDDGGDPPL